MLRRSFGTIHQGHIPKGTIEDFFYGLKAKLERLGYLAGAFALEFTKEGKKHIQFYCEHPRKRVTTLASDFGVTTEYVFDKVRDAPGSWAYCTGTGAHRDKPAIDRFNFGVPKLYGDTQRADLKLLIGLAMDGITPEELLRTYPYAWAVHRQRMLAFYRDWHDLQTSGLIGAASDPIQ